MALSAFEQASGELRETRRLYRLKTTAAVSHEGLLSTHRIYQAGYTCKGLKWFFMAHTLEEKKKLLNRVRRIRGQVEAIDRALEQEAECSDVLHNISACRGAMDALMAEVIEGHIRFHILDPGVTPSDEQAQAADDLIHALRAYLK
jgi:DNA-binding FrmR family transcriptional regulator